MNFETVRVVADFVSGLSLFIFSVSTRRCARSVGGAKRAVARHGREIIRWRGGEH